MNFAHPAASASRFGVLISTQPLNPTSFHSSSLATLCRMFGFVAAASAEIMTPASKNAVTKITAEQLRSNFIEFLLACDGRGVGQTLGGRVREAAPGDQHLFGRSATLGFGVPPSGGMK